MLVSDLRLLSDADVSLLRKSTLVITASSASLRKCLPQLPMPELASILMFRVTHFFAQGLCFWYRA